MDEIQSLELSTGCGEVLLYLVMSAFNPFIKIATIKNTFGLATAAWVNSTLDTSAFCENDHCGLNCGQQTATKMTSVRRAHRFSIAELNRREMALCCVVCVQKFLSLCRWWRTEWRSTGGRLRLRGSSSRSAVHAFIRTKAFWPNWKLTRAFLPPSEL